MSDVDDLKKADEELERLLRRGRERGWEREARRKSLRRPDGKRYRPKPSDNRPIADAALVCEPVPGDARGAEFWITYGGMRDSWLALRADPACAELHRILEIGDPEALNGYVAFPKRNAPRVPLNKTGSIVQYIPVHGGVTWARKDSFMAVWGFDTAHYASEKQPRTDQDWIRANCWVLYRGLLLAEKLWPEFRRASQTRRAEIADQLLGLIEEQPLLDKMGFEALIGLLAGRIG